MQIITTRYTVFVSESPAEFGGLPFEVYVRASRFSVVTMSAAQGDYVYNVKVKTEEEAEELAGKLARFAEKYEGPAADFRASYAAKKDPK